MKVLAIIGSPKKGNSFRITQQVENCLKNYKILTLQGIDEIEPIFPEDDPKSKKNQQPLTTYT